jgi:hypothetical protein
VCNAFYGFGQRSLTSSWPTAADWRPDAHHPEHRVADAAWRADGMIVGNVVDPWLFAPR